VLFCRLTFLCQQNARGISEEVILADMPSLKGQPLADAINRLMKKVKTDILHLCVCSPRNLSLIRAQRWVFCVPKICYWSVMSCHDVSLSSIQWRASNRQGRLPVAIACWSRTMLQWENMLRLILAFQAKPAWWAGTVVTFINVLVLLCQARCYILVMF